MEAMHFFAFKYGDRQTGVVLTSSNPKALEDALLALGKRVNQFSWSRKDDTYKVEMSMLIKKKDYPLNLLKRLKELPDVELESLD